MSETGNNCGNTNTQSNLSKIGHLSDFTQQSTNGKNDYIGVEQVFHGPLNGQGDTDIDQTTRIRFAYLSNAYLDDVAHNFPTRTYYFDAIDLCLSDFKSLFFKPISGSFALSPQNYYNVAYLFHKQTYPNTSGTQQFNLNNAILETWASNYGKSEFAAATKQIIQLTKSAHGCSMPKIRATIVALTFDELLSEWLTKNPQTNCMNCVIEVDWYYDPLQVGVKLFFSYNVCIPGSSYGNDTSCVSNILTNYQNDTGNTLNILPTDCACDENDVNQPKTVNDIILEEPQKIVDDEFDIQSVESDEMSLDDVFMPNQSASDVNDAATGFN